MARADSLAMSALVDVDAGGDVDEHAAVVVAVGHVRDPAIEYIIAGGQIQDRSVFFWSQFSSVNAAVGTFQNDG